LSYVAGWEVVDVSEEPAISISVVEVMYAVKMEATGSSESLVAPIWLDGVIEITV
jgi:hypothetical protein